MTRVYVAGPYRAPTEHGVAENIWRARAVALDLWRRGYAAFCPHLNTAFFGGAADDAVWLRGDLEWLRFADMIVLVPSWQNSAGTITEIKEARRLGIPIYEWEEGKGPQRLGEQWLHCFLKQKQ